MTDPPRSCSHRTAAERACRLPPQANFLARWNDDEAPSNVAPIEAPPPKLGNDTLGTGDVAHGAGAANVQVVRTFACSYGAACAHACYAANAPKGELSHRDALVKAIGLAQVADR